MMSKRNPSTWYCVAKVDSVSTISFSIIANSGAVFWQQVEVAMLPSPSSR
jgi:hypothetical protein